MLCIIPLKGGFSSCPHSWCMATFPKGSQKGTLSLPYCRHPLFLSLRRSYFTLASPLYSFGVASFLYSCYMVGGTNTRINCYDPNGLKCINPELLVRKAVLSSCTISQHHLAKL